MRFESTIFDPHAARHAFAVAAATLVLCIPARSNAALQWAGRTWNVTNGGMAGVAAGSPSNVSVDDNGYLHLKIVKNGSTWTAAELFTTDKLGFGTYQWQVDAPIDRFDKNVVLGLYPYGPAAGIGKDGTNEIDIEYSFWGNANGVNGDWTDYPASGTVIGEKSYKFSLDGGTLSTSRFIWSTSKIENYLINGLQPVGSTTDLLNSWTYAPNNSQVNIPQQPLPLGINLWCFDNPPSDGKNVEVVIRNFQFVPEGTSPGTGGAGAGGASGLGGASSGGGSATAGASSGTAGASDTTNGGSPASNGGAPTAGSGTNNGGAGDGGLSNGGAGNGEASGASSTSAGARASGAGAAGSPSSSAGALGGSAAGTASHDPEPGQESGCSVSPRAPRSALAWLSLLPLLVLGARRRQRAG